MTGFAVFHDAEDTQQQTQTTVKPQNVSRDSQLLHTRQDGHILSYGVPFRQFRPLTTDDVTSAIRRLPDKTSSADPVSYTHLTLPTIYSV